MMSRPPFGLDDGQRRRSHCAGLQAVPDRDGEEATSVDDIANIVVGNGLRVRDVASVGLGTEDHVRIVAGDGKPAALHQHHSAGRRQHGGDRRQCREGRGEIRKTLPPGIVLKAVYDQASLVRDASSRCAMRC